VFQRLCVVLVLLLLLSSPIIAYAVSYEPIITTIAGNGYAGFYGDGGSATDSFLNFPYGIESDDDGNIYIADSINYRIRKIITPTGIITTIAGNGTSCLPRTDACGDNGLATAAQLNIPTDVAVDKEGNVYIADWHTNRIRKVIAATGIITTVAGTGNGGFSGDNGLAVDAQLGAPWGVAVNDAGDIYIADSSNNRIRKVIAATGIITTVAGNGNPDFGGDNGLAIDAQLYNPKDVDFDGVGNLYIVDRLNHRIRKVISATGVITTVAGNGDCDFGGDNGPATAAQLCSPRGIAVDEMGNFYIADTINDRIRKVDASTGIIITIAGGGTTLGDGGLAYVAELANPCGVAVNDESGGFIIADSENHRIREVAYYPLEKIYLPIVLK
jgi:sugar lactone lactonase YvrE